MSLDNVREKILHLPDKDFKQLCKKIAAGMGFFKAKVYLDVDIPLAFRETLVRESTDKMFRTEESWMIVFLNSPSRDSLKLFPNLVKAAEAAGDQHLFTVAFFELDEETREIYHGAARNLEIRSILVSGEFALDLACDYDEELNKMVRGNRFSFARVRKEMKEMAGKADWRSQFQSLTSLPTRVSPGREEADMEEADLSRAAFKTPSFLLLGEPGAGKTTSLQVLTEVLATAGGALPVFMPLNRYSGHLLMDLGEILCAESAPLAEAKTLDLLGSGALLVMLDGLNEVRVDAVNQIAEEINRYTDPGSPASRSGWIVSGRKYDYRVSRKPLEHLEKHTWLLQPLTPDLIYTFLAAGLGEAEGKEVYGKLGPAVREICANPLLLNMVLTVRRETGKLPDGRGALYHCFIDLLFRWGDKTAQQGLLEEMSKPMGYPVTGEEYIQIANFALLELAAAMGTTAVPWGEARDIVMAKSLSHARDGATAAKTLLEDLVKRGILKSQQYRVSFFHHTFQEYYQALRMKDLPIEVLIPSEGVAGAYREAVVFLAGLMGDAGRLTERALTYDYLLAYEMVRDAGPLINQEIKLKVAKKLWDETTTGGGWVGEKRPLALKFTGLASRMGRTVEQLARDISKPSDEIFTFKLLLFYQHIGDLVAQKKLIESMQIKNDEEINEFLNYQIIESVFRMGDFQRTVDLYTKFLEKYPNISSAYHNRAVSYRNLGKKPEALADYKKALELDPKNSMHRTNLAILLNDMGEKEKALVELKTAITDDPNYATAHFELGNLLESSSPGEALAHFEKAARLSIDTKDYQRYLKKLAGIQETLGRYGGAVRSLKQLIEMNPTSSKVKEWKQRIARVRLEMDKQEKSRTLRERLHEGGDLPLPVFAREFLAAVGLDTRQASSLWVFTDTRGSALPTPLPFVLLDVHVLTGADLRETIASAPKQVKGADKMILLTTADVIENDAMMQLSAFQAEKKIALVTFAEAQEAFLQGDRYCYQLVERALRRADTAHDPFDYTEVIRERSEFFGRTLEIKAIMSALQNHQTMGLYGIHKIGKTSLLKQVNFHLTAFSRDITTLWVEMEPGVKTISDLYHLILEQLPGEDPGIPDDTFLTTRQFREKLAHFQRQKQRERPNHHLLLILDEYPFLIPGILSFSGFSTSSRTGQVGGVKDYIEALGTFKSLTQEGWFTLLPCGRSAALSRVVRWDEGENPFIGILKEKFLGPITREETFTLLKALGNRTGIRFDEKALESIYALSGGHPFFTRKLGSWLLHFKKGNRIEAAMVEQAAKAYLANRGERALLLGSYEEKLEAAERRIVRLLAGANQPLPAKDLMPVNADEITYRRVRDAVANLIDTTVIKEDENKKLSHNYELLRRVIEEDTREQEQWTT